jgi:hypothetical protein
LIQKQQRVHGGNLEPFTARLADDLVVYANQMVAQLGELRAITFVGARRQAILLRAPHPAHGVFIGATTPRAAQSLGAIFISIGEECAFV